MVRITYIDPLKKDWGGAKPIITFEYDERNRYLLVITIEYAKRMAKKSLVFTANELQEKIMDELNAMVSHHKLFNNVSNNPYPNIKYPLKISAL